MLRPQRGLPAFLQSTGTNRPQPIEQKWLRMMAMMVIDSDDDDGGELANNG